MRDARLREDRRERPLDDRQHADDVAALLAGEREVVDVEDRHLRAAACEQPDRVGRLGRRADAQLDALGAVVVARERRVDRRRGRRSA